MRVSLLLTAAAALIGVSSAVLNGDPAVTTKIENLGLDIEFETEGRELTYNVSLA